METHQLFNSPIHQLLCHLNEVTHLVNHAARLGRVLQLDRVANPQQAEALHHGLLRAAEPGRALHQRHLDGGAFRVGAMIRHDYALVLARSASSLPRIRAIVDGSFSESSPWQVARTTLWALADPSDLVTMFPMPAASTTARTAPPAMMPVPSGAGFSS